MININTNSTLNELQDIVNLNMGKRLDYMPDSFNEQQQYALQLFKQRVYLEKTIDETIAFNKKVKWEDTLNLSLTTTAEELVDVFKLRSDIYATINYQKEFPDPVEGLNFDDFDNNSAIIYYKKDEVISGTTRVIFDSKLKLPSDDKFTLDYIRDEKQIAELSRLAVNNEKKGMSFEFKHLMKGAYNVFVNNNVDKAILGIKEEHLKLYEKFGGVNIETKLSNYGNIDLNALILTWDPKEISKFFKKGFLK